MRVRIWHILFLVLLLSMSSVGCGELITKDISLSAEEQAVSDILDQLTPEAEFAPVIKEVFSFKKNVTLVFEGYSNEQEMMELADIVKKSGVKATFFIPGQEAMNHPTVIKYIGDAGIKIGNYTLTGEKAMEQNNTKKIVRQIYMTQKAVEETLAPVPKYLLCNQTEYTDEILQIANLCGIKGVVKPNIYLNHRSFQYEEQILNYTKNIVPGSVISFKIGQELAASEFDKNPVDDDRPVVDKKPTIGDVEDVPAIETPTDSNIARIVEVFLNEADEQGFEFLTLKEFHKLEDIKVEEFEVPEELLERLNPENYPNNTTPKPFGLEESEEPVSGDYFNKTVFVGDSILQGIENYVKRERATNPDFFGTAQFLYSSGLSVRNALWEVNSESRHPAYNGTSMKIEDAIGQMDVNKVYIMLGMNDVLLSTTDQYLDNYQKLIMLIQDQSPNVEFFLCSVTPGSEGDIQPSNEQIFTYTLKLVEFCAKYGYNYVDVAYAIRDENGCLPLEMCSDPDKMSRHFTDEASKLWIDYIYSHTK